MFMGLTLTAPRRGKSQSGDVQRRPAPPAARQYFQHTTVALAFIPTPSASVRDKLYIGAPHTLSRPGHTARPNHWRPRKQIRTQSAVAPICFAHCFVLCRRRDELKSCSEAAHRRGEFSSRTTANSLADRCVADIRVNVARIDEPTRNPRCGSRTAAHRLREPRKIEFLPETKPCRTTSPTDRCAPSG
jgi:hypothetical protein